MGNNWKNCVPILLGISDNHGFFVPNKEHKWDPEFARLQNRALILSYAVSSSPTSKFTYFNRETLVSDVPEVLKNMTMEEFQVEISHILFDVKADCKEFLLDFSPIFFEVYNLNSFQFIQICKRISTICKKIYAYFFNQCDWKKYTLPAEKSAQSTVDHTDALESTHGKGSYQRQKYVKLGSDKLQSKIMASDLKVVGFLKWLMEKDENSKRLGNYLWKRIMEDSSRASLRSNRSRNFDLHERRKRHLTSKMKGKYDKRTFIDYVSVNANTGLVPPSTQQHTAPPRSSISTRRTVIILPDPTTSSSEDEEVPPRTRAIVLPDPTSSSSDDEDMVRRKPGRMQKGESVSEGDPPTSTVTSSPLASNKKTDASGKSATDASTTLFVIVPPKPATAVGSSVRETATKSRRRRRRKRPKPSTTSSNTTISHKNNANPLYSSVPKRRKTRRKQSLKTLPPISPESYFMVDCFAKGLKNSSNWNICYMNSIFNFLLQIKEIRLFLVSSREIHSQPLKLSQTAFKREKKF